MLHNSLIYSKGLVENEFGKIFISGLRTEEDPAAAMSGAEAVLLLTEWNEFTGLDPHEAATWVSRPVMIDGRNALDPEQWREAGWTYAGLGR